MKIMEMLERHMRITKIMKIIIFHLIIKRNHENLRIQKENHENHNNPKNPRETLEKNIEILKIHFRIMKIMEIYNFIRESRKS